MRRHLVFIVVCLLSGAILNALAGFACILAAQSRPGNVTSLNREDVDSRILRYNLPITVTMADGRMERFGYLELRMFVYNTKSLHDPSSSPSLRLTEINAGWPLKSLQYFDLEPDHTPDAKLFFGAQRAVTSANSNGLIVPTRPVWPAFAINTMFYAVIVWLLFLAPFKLRRWRRIRRGLCPACAYPVGSSDRCTECGRRLVRSDISNSSSPVQNP